jgi:RND family efflux transporter MFP subunit
VTPRRLACSSLVLVLVAALGAGCGRPASESGDVPEAEPSARVETATVAPGPVLETLETYGTVEFDPERTRSVSLVRSGEVLEVPVVAGAEVEQGDTLLVLGPVPSGAPEVQNARIDFSFAEQELARVKRLAALRLATNQDVESAEQRLAAARAGLRALGDVPGQGRIAIRAPGNGVVAQVLVTPGSRVQPGENVVVLAPAGAVAIRTGFEVEDLPRLSEGLEVRIDAISGDPRSPSASARLARLHRVADPATQLVEALVAVEDPPRWMVAGERARLRAVLRSVPDALRVPREALVERDGGVGVFVVADGHAHWRAVRTGIADEAFVEVVEGLSPGDVVVTTGRTSLADGMAVRTADAVPGS